MTLDVKLVALKNDPRNSVFILADAKNAGMAFGKSSTEINRDGTRRSLAIEGHRRGSDALPSLN
jgi:hypothetical protein